MPRRCQLLHLKDMLVTTHQVSHVLSFALASTSLQSQPRGTSSSKRAAEPTLLSTALVKLRITSPINPLAFGNVRALTQLHYPYGTHVLNQTCTILVEGTAEELEALLLEVFNQPTHQRITHIIRPRASVVPSPIPGLFAAMGCG